MLALLWKSICNITTYPLLYIYYSGNKAVSQNKDRSEVDWKKGFSTLIREKSILSKHNRGGYGMYVAKFTFLSVCAITIGSTKADTDSLQNTLTYPLFRAKYSYTAAESDELSFKKGSLLYIIKSKQLCKNWWYARTKDSGEEGHVPYNYLEEMSLNAYPLKFVFG